MYSVFRLSREALSESRKLRKPRKSMYATLEAREPVKAMGSYCSFELVRRSWTILVVTSRPCALGSTVWFCVMYQQFFNRCPVTVCFVSSRRCSRRCVPLVNSSIIRTLLYPKLWRCSDSDLEVILIPTRCHVLQHQAQSKEDNMYNCL